MKKLKNRIIQFFKSVDWPFVLFVLFMFIFYAYFSGKCVWGAF